MGHLEIIEQKIMELEESPDDVDLINEIFRPIHSMKGAAGFLGLTETNRLTHEIETLLDRARKHTIAVGPDIIDLALASVDKLRQLTGKLLVCIQAKQGKTFGPEAFPIVDIETLVAEIQGAHENKGKKARQTAAGSGTADQPQSKQPPRLGDILVARGDVTQEQIDAALELQESPIGEILVKTGVVSPEQVQAALQQQAQARRAADTAPTGAIKVDVSKLDALADLVGELVITQSLVQQSPRIAELQDPALARSISQLGKITNDIRDRVMTLRMMPIRQTFQKMARLARDLSRKSGKKVELAISGEEIELDKTVIGEIGDPLVHLIRNSLDHGIEPPEERRVAGKPETGKVSLNAYRQGESIVIEIADDGQGLNLDKIRAQALKDGFIDESTQLSEEQIQQLIFLPGFSTAEQVTDISGRGVGMDVVKRNVENLRGRVEVWSEQGIGARFTVRLPLTMAIIDGTIVAAGG